MIYAVIFTSNIKLFSQNVGILVPQFCYCPHCGALSNPARGPCEVLAASWDVKSQSLWPGVVLSIEIILRRGIGEGGKHYDCGGSQAFRTGLWTPGSQFPFYSQVKKQPDSSMFSTRFEDYQVHLLGGSWMVLSSAVPRGRRERNGA